MYSKAFPKQSESGRTFPLTHEGEIVSNPFKMANNFKDFFINVRTLREKTASDPKVDPVVRLRSWIRQKGNLPKLIQLSPSPYPSLEPKLKQSKLG